VDSECIGGRDCVVTSWVSIGDRGEDGEKVEQKGQKK
jgi:hypothetical protein